MLVLGAFCAEAQHYDRGYETIPSSPFIQKGTWSVGGSAKYTQHINDNFSLMLINGINSQGYNISVNPKLIYHFRENMGVGLRFSYDRSMLDLASAEISVADITMGAMTLINIPVIFILSKYVVKALKDYEVQRKAGKKPVFKAENINLPDKVDYWQ